MAVTIRDVARVTGVSTSTVSRVFTAPEKVAEPTRILVLKMATEMGYEPNRAAQGLITGRTGCLGLVVPDLENPFFGSISKGVQDRARALGYSVFIADSDEDPNLEADVVRSIARQVDGVILCSARGSDNSVKQLASHTPLVLVNRAVDGVLSVSFDNGGGLRAIMSHFVALGHRKIAYAGGPARSWSNGERATVFLEYRETSPGLTLVELGNFAPTVSGGVQAADLAIASDVTAIITYNDLMAVGLIDRLSQRGLAVPIDISVASFDNVPVASMLRPTLTTVDLPRVQMGRVSVDALHDMIRGRNDDVGPPDDVAVELVIRNSTAVVTTLNTQLSPDEALRDFQAASPGSEE